MKHFCGRRKSKIKRQKGVRGAESESEIWEWEQKQDQENEINHIKNSCALNFAPHRVQQRYEKYALSILLFWSKIVGSEKRMNLYANS